MSTERHYEKAPITEAIIDLRVKLPEGVSLSDLERVHEMVVEEYPERKNRNLLETRMEVGKSVATSSRSTHIGFLCSSSDSRQVFQARRDGFTMSRLAPYQTWAHLRDEARRLWDVYREITSPAAIERVAVRYINRLDLPLPLADFRDYVRTAPEVSPDLPQGLAGFFFQVTIPQEDIGSTLLLNEAMVEPASPNVVSVVLDIDLFRTNGLSSKEEDLWNLLEKLRERKNEVFEACITDKLRELIR
jgi:uncharacterized protein (TIGR04255 family)